MQRDWRWHKLLRQWLRKDDPPPRDGGANPASSSLPLVDLTTGAPLGTQPIRIGDRAEKGVYVFFDAMNWRRERRWLELDYEHLDAGRTVPGPNGAPARLQTGADLGLSGVGVPIGGQVSGVGSSQIPSA
jgi:CCR4-NOT transcription complex subunit 2